MGDMTRPAQLPLITYGSPLANMRRVSADAIARKPKRGYVSATRSEQARQTRKRVIDAATRLFVQRGYATTTMRTVAAEAGVSLPTVELLFGTKAHLLHVVIDVAVAGDDEPVPVLSRAWAVEAQSARDVADFLSAVSEVMCEAQIRSAGVMLAAYEAAASDPDIDLLIADRESQRQGTASWIVDGVITRAALRPGVDRAAAIDTVWMLMDPVIFSRLTRHRGWSPDRYRSWFADSVIRLLVDPSVSREVAERLP
jgi:TetR/AcrR family transcriptional regulator, regulator of autoinduction and epiphytic fitness